MDISFLSGFLENLAILLIFSVLFEYVWILDKNARLISHQIFSGTVIGVIVIFLMLTPWTFAPGLFFDTRSVLLIISGLFLGLIPTLVAVIIAIIFRIFVGGEGLLLGMFSIFISGSFGLLWAYFRPKWQNNNSYIELLLLGYLVHLIIIGGFILIPEEFRNDAYRTMAIPILLIYPPATMLLGVLFLSRIKIKESKEEITKAEERWNLALLGAGDGVWDWDVKTNTVFFSKGWKSMLGYENHEISENSDEWDKRIHPDDRKRVYDQLNAYLEDKVPEYNNEHRLLCKDGNYKWILDRGKIVEWSEDKKPLRVIGTHTDIHQSKLNELALGQNDERNRLILNTAMDGFWIVNKHGELKEVNESYCQQSQFSRKELLKMKINDLEASENEEEIRSKIQKLIEVKSLQFQSQHRRKDNSIWDVEISINYLDSDEHLFYVFIKDITKQKDDERALINDNLRFTSTLNSINSAIYVSDLETYEVLFANDYVVKNTGAAIGKKCYKSLQKDMDGPCPFCTNDKLLDENGKPNKPYIWEFQNTVTKKWYHIEDVAIPWIDGRYVRMEIASDITERKNEEKILKESEERFRQLFQKSHTAVAIFKPTEKASDFTIVDFNPVAQAIEKVKLEDIKGKKVTEIFPGIKEFGLLKIFQDVYKTGKAQNHPVSFYKDERIAGYRENYVYKLLSGEIVSTYIDLTEEKIVEEKLNSLLSQLKGTLESTEEGILVIAEDDSILNYNKRFREIFSIPAEILMKGDDTTTIEHVLNQFMDPDSFLLRVKQIYSNPLMDSFDILQMKDKREIERHSKPLLVDDKPLGRVWSFRDITEKSKMINTLKESEELFRTAFYTSPDAVGISRVSDGMYIYINKGFTEITGYQEEEVVNKTAENIKIWGRPKDREKLIKILKEKGKVENFETLFKMKEGKLIYGLASATIIMLNNEPHILSIARDINDLKKTESEIKKLNKELEQRVRERTSQLEVVNKDLESFGYSVSHDLRAPLRHISGFSRMLKKSLSSTNPETERYLDKITESSSHMSQMIDDLLNFSRLGRKQPIKELTDLNKLIREEIKNLEIDNKNRIIEWKISPLPKVVIDSNLFSLVINNLLSNAIKFSANRAKTSIEIGQIKRGPNKCQLYIKDNGVGFDMAYYEKLFNVFQRLHTQEEYEGIGIGLANAHQIIKKHRGEIWAVSEENKGSTFFIRL